MAVMAIADTAKFNLGRLTRRVFLRREPFARLASEASANHVVVVSV
jgi:hypothetical protein